jgi:hypothetical protein
MWKPDRRCYLRLVSMISAREMLYVNVPNITFVPMAEARAVSESTFAETWALQSAPKEKAPAVIKNVAP